MIFDGNKQKNITICDNCGSVVKMKIIEKVIDHDGNGKDIKEQYLECSHCKKRFTIIILDEYTREKREEIRCGNHCANKKLLMEEMKMHQAVLKQKYGRT